MKSFYDSKNIQFWNELARIHSVQSDYDVNNYDPWQYQLKDIELSELGDLRGKRVLHLQCHIGLDSFALEIMGAEVSAIDYSSDAIDTANSIKNKFGLNTQFYCASVYDISTLALGEFDIIFTSYGVLVWLQHLDLWASTVASHLKSGGELLLIDEHPIARMFSNPLQDNSPFDSNALFNTIRTDAPVKANYKYSYANEHHQIENQEQYVWFHTLSEIITSLTNKGLCITAFQEFDKGFYKAFSQLSLHEDGWWRFSNGFSSIPLTFFLRARKF
ncbi:MULTISPECIES: class I SAM-dependent methyltransferase [Dickeya]|uniref:Class I SAM-dependent methyltransferase n=1 Tax=Dickeya oryzae TaxID=1240404 RepID=A0AB39IV52_9GAMM|nr:MULTISPECIES: class I SAM-dependent methyltransferase [Dickeya]MBP2849443.1 class I SAM-dependent methyltransferase [Dickeya oryzae]MBP2856270.1 class I SAM-dependent methyltransferase [Dickeya oryzae]MCA6989960.1 class I SAM-dependent methyltransferase [Dickeya oryzae]MCA6995391.1 class I SAM-dependent methyltransferase [Dickeya oryzae]